MWTVATTLSVPDRINLAPGWLVASHGMVEGDVDRQPIATMSVSYRVRVDLVPPPPRMVLKMKVGAGGVAA